MVVHPCWYPHKFLTSRNINELNYDKKQPSFKIDSKVSFVKVLFPLYLSNCV